MKKNLVKVLTLALAAATIASMSTMSVFAANTVITDGTWTATGTDAATTKQTITVTSVTDTKAKVTAYQIVKGVYTGGKLSDYVLCDATTAIADFKAPTANEVVAIAKAINAGTTTLTGIEMTKDGTKYTADVEAGLYIVIATDSDTVVYNPALVAVNITDPNKIATTAEGSTVDMKTYFNNPSKAYLKSSESNFDKSIVDSSMNNTEGDAVAYGDTVKFKLDKMTIPYYTAQYTTVQYKIEDNLEVGSFEGINNLSVTVGNTPAVEGTDYTVTYNKAETGTAGSSSAMATKFTIEFKDAYIRANGGKSVVVTYDSKFLEGAGLNYAENVNTAKLSYSNDPSDATSVKTIQDSTYHYTFGIDAELDAEATTDDSTHSAQDKETFELNKVTDAGETFEEATSTLTTKGTKRSPKWLDQAEFALYDDAAMTNVIREATSDKNGHIRFVGLDTGTYYMKETVAPPTYTINTNVYKIIIAATLNEEGIMTQYSIDTYLSTDGGNTFGETPVGKATYFNTLAKNSVDSEGNVTNSISAYDNITPVEIVNTKLAALPATGGEGTIAITIGGGLGMAGFLTLYIANKKKKKAE